MMDSPRRSEIIKGSFSILAASLLWSTGGLFIKVIPWAALSINAARCIIAIVFRTVQRKGIRFQFSWLNLAGALSFCGASLFFTLANQFTTAANTTLLQYVYPFFLMALCWIFLRRRPTGFDFATGAVIITGVFLCCYDNLEGGGMLGNIFALLSGLCFALYFFFNSFENAHPGEANYLGFWIGSLIGLPWLVRETVFTPKVIICIVILGAFQFGLAYLLFEFGIKRVPVLTASFITGIEPVIVPFLGAIFYNERMSPLAIIGGVLVVVAVLINSVLDAKRNKTQTSDISETSLSENIS